MSRRVPLFLSLVLAVGSLSAPAAAHSVWHHDTEEGADADILWSRAHFVEVNGARYLRAVVIVRPVEFLGRIRVGLDTRGDGHADAAIWIEGWGDSGFSEPILKGGGIYEPIPWRWSMTDAGERFAFFVPVKMLDLEKHLRYRVVEEARNSYDGDNSSDVAPNFGWYQH